MYDDKNIDELVNSILKNRDMIDEDELIVDDEKKVVEKREGFKKKPCANCNCSRKSEDTKKKSYSSKCGNCYLGDAFRCASCPYNGMPAFEPGEEMFFESDDLNKV